MAKIFQMLPVGAVRSSSPFPLKPMLASLEEKPFDDPTWIHEVKFDGYRIIAEIKNGKPSLLSRGQLDYTKKYPPVAEALKEIGYNAVLDGEVVVLDKNLKPDFNALQNFRPGFNLAYYIFDLLWLDGYLLTGVPLLKRKELLNNILPDSGVLKFSAHFEKGVLLFNKLKEMGWEGIVAKKKESIYYPGKRVEHWLKIPVVLTGDYVIGGWIDSDSGRLFSALIFGSYDNGNFVYKGHAGGGYNEKDMKIIYRKLKHLETAENPFPGEVDIKDKHKIHWIEPKLTAEIKTSNKKSPSGSIRHPPIFVRMREDKKPEEIKHEPKQKSAELLSKNKTERNPIASERNNPGNQKLKPKKITSEEAVEIDGHKLILTNVEHHVWKNVTKAELFTYYHNIWPYISPYLKDRPLGLHSNPYGAKGPDAWIRHMEKLPAGWAEIFITERKHKKPGKSGQINWLICNNEITLFYIINLDCIDLHPWSSRRTAPEFPDYLILDLDPQGNDFKKVIETARAAEDFFAGKKLISFIKTSGKSGMHIYIPCEGIKFGDARKIAERISSSVASLIPEITTTDVSVGKRGNRLYIDPSQNDYSDRIAAPYCVRAFEEPLISAPLEWKEVNSKLSPYNFTIHNFIRRLEKKGDLLGGLILKKNQKHNSKILKTFL